MDANHPDRKALEKYSQAGASAAEERWIESHLRSGCRVCQREVDDLLSTMNPSPQDAPSSDGGDDASLVRQGLFARLERRLAEVKEERREAPPLVAELLGHPAPQRRGPGLPARPLPTPAGLGLPLGPHFPAGGPRH